MTTSPGTPAGPLASTGSTTGDLLVLSALCVALGATHLHGGRRLRPDRRSGAASA